MSPDFKQKVSNSWMAAHRLITYPEQLHAAQELARQEIDPARLLASLLEKKMNNN